MATSARKSARTSSRLTRSKSSTTQNSRSARKSSRKVSTRSRKPTTRTRSSAKIVRGRKGTRAVSRNVVARSKRLTTPKNTSKQRVTRIKNRSGRRQKTRAKNTSFFIKLFTTLGVLFGGILVVLVILIIVWFFVLPSVLLSSIQNKNFILASNDINSLEGQILLAHFGEKPSDHVVYVVDGSERVEVPNGYGQYAIGAVPTLLSVDTQSAETTRSVMSRIVGVPVDVVLTAAPLQLTALFEDQMVHKHEATAFFFTSDVAEEVRARAFSVALADPAAAVALLRISFAARAQQPDTIPVRSYQETVSLFDNSAALVLTAEEQTCAVAVINTTGTSGLARETAHLLETNGVYVVREDSTATTLDVSQMQLSATSRPTCQSVAEKIASFFPESLVQTTQAQESVRYRADIVIMLGMDMADLEE